jgi:hypothetical protein
MINTSILYRPARETTIQRANIELHSPNGKELSRLITAAVINPGFRKTLLTNPAEAIANGFQGESFRLAIEEQNLVISIQADTLSDFARQLVNSKNGKGGNGHNGHNGYRGENREK